MRYDTWDSTDGRWTGEYASMNAAIHAAAKAGNCLVTERTPIGDPRISMVEDAAVGWFRNRPAIQKDLKWCGEAIKRIEEAEANAGELPALTRAFRD